MDDDEKQLDRIGDRVRQLMSDDASASEELRRGRSAFLAEVVQRQQSPARAPRTPRRLLPWAVAASLATATTGLWLWARARPLSFEVGETASGQLGQRIEALEGKAVPLNFSDGSSLLLHPGAKMRVLSLGSSATRVLVEDGALDVRVAHRSLRKVRWDLEAGPFHVQVTGTKFQMVFHAALQSFRLATEEGQVMVSGCEQQPRTVSAGQSIDLSCPREGLVPPVQAAARAPAQPTPTTETVPPPARTTKGEPSWRELLAAGRTEEALRMAERGNFDRACQTASSKELLALADAARLSGSHQRAITALQRLRQHYPRSMDASIAAFTLGRIAFEKLHAYGEAASWFDTYMREQPDGPLMGDSFGRRMEARMRAGDQAQARRDAEQYLRRFPRGPYADEARSLLSK
jgi:TolA-binding protein